VRMLIRVPGRRRIGRVLGTLYAIFRCSRAGYRTYFLRYSRLFLTMLVITYPLLRHRILLWRSNLDVMEHERRNSPRHRMAAVLDRVLTRFVHRHVTGPEKMVALMSRQWRIPASRIGLLYNDVDPGRFAPLAAQERTRVRARCGWRDDEFVILFVHRLSYRRGARTLGPLLESMLADTDGAVRLVVVGDGPDRPLVERVAADPRLRGRMQVLGPVANRDLPPIYGAADCFLMPSYEEGFPRVLLEAMASELPVVTTDAGGSSDVVGADYPFIAPVGDLDRLAEHLRTVARLSPDERRALGRRLRVRAKTRFSPDQAAEMLMELL
jgi:glycosyltransferase involved in cell wall biosynthesis